MNLQRSTNVSVTKSVNEAPMRWLYRDTKSDSQLKFSMQDAIELSNREYAHANEFNKILVNSVYGLNQFITLKIAGLNSITNLSIDLAFLDGGAATCAGGCGRVVD